MVVHDDPGRSWHVGDLAEHRGYDVLMAMDGLAALHLILQQRAHVIITDINMPGMDGVSFCSRLKSNRVRLMFPSSSVARYTNYRPR
jgi:two-component system, chemotaxis family, chemotaxis protein CheY